MPRFVRMLQVWNELLNIWDVRWVEHNRAVHALLALALLLEKVAAAVALHSQLAGTRLSDSLLCAAV